MKVICFACYADDGSFGEFKNGVCQVCSQIIKNEEGIENFIEEMQEPNPFTPCEDARAYKWPIFTAEDMYKVKKEPDGFLVNKPESYYPCPNSNNMDTSW